MAVRTLGFCALLVIATAASAGKPFDIHGLIVGNEGARYVKGVPTLDLQQRHGAVQLRSRGFYNNRPVFAVAFFNAGPEPVNIGIEDIHVSVNGEAHRIFPVEELQRQAKNDAGWKTFLTALGGAMSASAAANQTDSYSGTILSPDGIYSVSMSGPSLAGQLRAERIEAQTAYSIAAIQDQLDRTIEAFDDRVIQRTTVDPGAFYGGLIVLDKLKQGDPPFEMRLDIDWNGERYPFAYVLQRPGRAVPSQYAGMLAANAKPRALTGTFAPPADPSVATTGDRRPPPKPAIAQKAVEGAIYLRSGVVKIPAKTASGYCLKTPPGYKATGSIDYPAVTGGLPRCNETGEYERQSSFRPDRKRY